MRGSRTTSRSRIPACRTTSRSSPARPTASRRLHDLQRRRRDDRRPADACRPELGGLCGGISVRRALCEEARAVSLLSRDGDSCSAALALRPASPSGLRVRRSGPLSRHARLPGRDGRCLAEAFVTPLLAVQDTVVFVVFDEGSRGNHVPAFALGSAVRRTRSSLARVDHYGLLRTIEDMFGCAARRRRRRRPITGIWR